MSQPTRGLAANGSKVRQLRAKADELMQHLDDAAQLEDIQQQVENEAPELQPALPVPSPLATPAQQAAALADKFTLTGSQQAIHDLILLDVADPNVHTVGLFGFAGVGKTVTTGALVSSLQREYGEGVVLCATTHKAARQVEKAMANLGIRDAQCITIHRLLGVRQVRDHNTGEEYFAADPNNPPVLDEQVRVVILDETSMLPQQLHHLLMDACGLFQTVIFVGDDRQIPPVSDGKLCAAFDEATR